MVSINVVKECACELRLAAAQRKALDASDVELLLTLADRLDEYVAKKENGVVIDSRFISESFSTVVSLLRTITNLAGLL